jgi:hypothetical protein
MKFQSWRRVGLAMKRTGPLPPDFLDFVAPTAGAFNDGDNLCPLQIPFQEYQERNAFPLLPFRVGWLG